MTTHKILGYTIGLAWAIGCLWVGVFLVEGLAQEFGNTFGALLPLFMLAWLAVIFAGRALWERVLSAIISLDHTSTGTETSGVVYRSPSPVLADAIAVGIAITILPFSLSEISTEKLPSIDPNIKTSTVATSNFSGNIKGFA